MCRGYGPRHHIRCPLLGGVISYSGASQYRCHCNNIQHNSSYDPNKIQHFFFFIIYCQLPATKVNISSKPHPFSYLFLLKYLYIHMYTLVEVHVPFTRYFILQFFPTCILQTTHCPCKHESLTPAQVAL